ncbi:Spy/CpxP family protein refolding chaperone [Pararobbsia silviterrae]|nr:Spy/CpxP family protein refolding chaperone [Pararobbsia silviterrae]
MKLVLATLAAATSLACASGAYAQAAASAPAPASAATAAKVAKFDQKADARLEDRIKDLHAKLQIKPDQEALFGKLADTMRSNAQHMRELYEQRMTQTDTFTAIDDLKSYGDLAQAHADSIKNLEASFEPLYAALSDTQKKAADVEFRHTGQPHPGGKPPRHHPKPQAAPADAASAAGK